MSKSQVRKIVERRIVGQGNQIDLGAALPKVVDGILDMLPSAEETSALDLRAKVAEGKLIPNALYRITDYVATTIQKGTRSANHPFDILVVALDEKTLSENAYAIQHEGDEYFAKSKLSAWEIKYTIENDTRYTWAETDKLVDVDGFNWHRRPFLDKDIEGVHYYAYWETEDNQLYYLAEEPKVAGTYEYFTIGGTDPESQGEYEFASFVESQGKGVIYYMKDEFGNVLHYDFKGIQFLRDTEWCEDSKHETFVEEVLGGESKDWWLYAFSWLTESGDIQDQSIVCNDGQHKNDEGRIVGCVDNTFGIVDAYSLYEIEGLFALDDTLFVSSETYDGGVYYGCYGNHFDTNCYRNTFGNYCYNNTFGNNAYGNTFGNGVGDNTFGNYCRNNTFGNYCYSNTFGNNCQNNTFGNYCYNNTFGNNAYGNTFGNYCRNNTFGNDCYDNTFGNNAYGNTFGNYCRNNTFGNGVGDNTFGNNCQNNTFGNYCYSNTFGNYCYSNTFGNGVGDNTFGNNAYGNTFGNYCYNNTFGNYCRNNTFGNNPDNIKYIKVLNGVQGKTISVVADATYCQFVGLTTSGQLKVWNPAD